MNELLNNSLTDIGGFWDLLWHFVLNLAVVLVIIRFFYYPQEPPQGLLLHVHDD